MGWIYLTGGRGNIACRGACAPEADACLRIQTDRGGSDRIAVRRREEQRRHRHRHTAASTAPKTIWKRICASFLIRLLFHHPAAVGTFQELRQGLRPKECNRAKDRTKPAAAMVRVCHRKSRESPDFHRTFTAFYLAVY